jgi:hypothetical protein
MLGETYLIEIFIPGTNNWIDLGMKSRFAIKEEAEQELEKAIKSYNSAYKFRINHIVCTETIVAEKVGSQDILSLN